jgi:tetratricopeptide (TPR) repeat protein
MGEVRFWLGLVAGVGPVALALLTWRRFPWLGLGVAWAVLSFGVVSNLVFPVGIWIAERTLYLPSVGVSIVVAGGLTALARSHSDSRARAVALVVAVVVGAGAWKSWTRNPVWLDSESVVQALLDEHPESYRAQWWLAGQLIDSGKVEEGLRWLRAAVALNPNQALVVLDLARALILAGEVEEAERRVRLIPSGLHPSRSVYLAQSLIEQAREDEARDIVAEGLRLFPEDVRLRGQARQLGIE